MSNSTRPSSSSSYDERFVVPLEASRRGAHRARVSPVMAVLPVAAVVGIVVGAIALVYLFLGGGGSDAGADATTSVGPSASSAAPSTTAPAAGASSTGPTGPSSAVAPGTVDKTIQLDVFNGTRPNVSGLGRKAANRLTAAGWTTGKIATWDGPALTQTTVFYGTAEQKASAQAVVKALGRGTVKLSPSRAGTGMSVVVANDYPGAGAGVRVTAAPSRSTAADRTPTEGATRTSAPGASSTTKASSAAATQSSAEATASTGGSQTTAAGNG